MAKAKEGVRDTAYIVYDTESVADSALLSRVRYAEQGLSPQEALALFEKEATELRPDAKPFVPVTFQVPAAIAVARVGADFRLRGLTALDAPRFESQQIVKDFWRGLEQYHEATLVDFNGRGFDLPLLTVAAFRFGISCPRYFRDPDRFGFRYRFTSKHIDLMEWLSEYGSFRVTGGLDLLAKILGKPGKMGTSGGDVQALYEAGKLQEINDYCVHDVLDTYFVFLRTRVLTGQITLEQEQEIVEQAREWIESKCDDIPGLMQYVENFGTWVGEPFV